ncbi:MAG TPA: HD domain-containing protein [Desulfitobacterium dehalogenans]|uniref:HD domain-containing protein n=1 Tax=Desulfitobacterium dehalogenans TaxID=36854 RepID=A0A7C6Z5H7_9FIRM|nr:HD domain-containing protein [Desulfitobacterium dehalogenans]
MISMPRVNRILQHRSYEEFSDKNKQAEEKRVYCRHGSDHGLAVARIAYIYLLERYIEDRDSFSEAGTNNANTRLEESYGVGKESIYASGILHDIGRWVEYESQEDHALAGARLARPILGDCGFTDVEIERIVLGILEHRLHPDKTSSILGQALALADDWARDCKNCASQATCYKYTKAMEDILI